jgi:hypothetical protein
MRIGWIGFHFEGVAALRALLERRVPIVAAVGGSARGTTCRCTKSTTSTIPHRSSC